jgi:hypothetical protein
MTRLAFAVLALEAVGCTSFQNRVPDVPIAPARMVVMPVTVLAFELDASDERTLQEEATDAMRSNVDDAVRAEAAARGIRFVTRELDNQDQGTKSLYGRLYRWTAKVSLEIAAQATGRRDFGRHSVGDWRFPGDLAPLAAALQAETALSVFVRDTSETTGRRLMGGLGGVYTYWKKIGVACLVSLHDGRMVWCETKVDAWFDLKDPKVASDAIGELLAGLGGPGAKRRSTPSMPLEPRRPRSEGPPP